jgi:hypothetical protein
MLSLHDDAAPMLDELERSEVARSLKSFTRSAMAAPATSCTSAFTSSMACAPPVSSR